MTTGAGLIACPRCDALHIEEELQDGETARCVRCAGVLARPRAGAFTQIIALAITTMVLIIGAVFFPFLEISRLGLGHGTSLFGVAMAFSEGVAAPLAIAVLAMIVATPALRAALLVYTLLPLARGRPPYAHAAHAFRLSEQLKPWSMAEIFIIGTAVAMVKVGGLATISFGPAFWAFCALIFVSIANHSFMCATTIWDAIEDSGLQTQQRGRTA
ncbi:MAG: paraquat-inducible protein A [Paracoccus sp. (in: a-proteobacteria)]|nr:paraquat-inducible protein A [Paracoccus sp. (in: a-proteobacteria)]